MKTEQIEIKPDGSVRITERRFEYDAVLPFERLYVRACTEETLEAVALQPMRLQRFYLRADIAQFFAFTKIEVIEKIATDGVFARSVFHGKGDVPGNLFADDLDTFDEMLPAGAVVRVTLSNDSGRDFDVVMCGLGRREPAVDLPSRLPARQAMLDAQRDEALEEAARIADRNETNAWGIARAIRALKSTLGSEAK